MPDAASQTKGLGLLMQCCLPDARRRTCRKCYHHPRPYCTMAVYCESPQLLHPHQILSVLRTPKYRLRGRLGLRLLCHFRRYRLSCALRWRRKGSACWPLGRYNVPYCRTPYNDFRCTEDDSFDTATTRLSVPGPFLCAITRDGARIRILIPKAIISICIRVLNCT
eukprot:SAG22_NODE_1707_length_3769_cov_3.054768_2_plen_166_part_00